MNHQIGDRVSWRGVNRDFTGEVVGIAGPCALVRVDASGKSVLIQNEPYQKPKLLNNE